MSKGLLITLYFSLAALSAFAQPNFVIIMSDDMGWTGTSVQMDPDRTDSKSGFYFTPNIDSLLAQKGLTFTRGYAAAAKCAPTRCSIQTGRTSARNMFTETGSGLTPDEILVSPSTENSINTSDTTIAEWFKINGLGYQTAHFGKWHIGSDGTSNHGYDEGDGDTNNNDGDNGGGAQSNPKQIDSLTSRSIDFMTRNVASNNPFFLQISHYSVHTTIEYRQSTYDKYLDETQRPPDPNSLHTNIDYAAMTEDLDEVIGEVITAVQNLGIEENTYIVFKSDNGGARGQSDNTPLRLGKSFIHEGGIRTPFIIRGPGISAGTYSNEPVVSYDLFPTFAALTESTVSLPTNLDGQNLAAVWESDQDFTRQSPLIFHIPHYSGGLKNPNSAAIHGDYKLIVDYETGDEELYNISKDPGESIDSAVHLPLVKDRLKIALKDHLKEVSASMPTLNDTLFIGTATDLDNDGLEDEWEFRELLSYHYGPNDDPDGDGDDNITEFNNGTDPIRHNESYLDCTSNQTYPNDTFTIDHYVPTEDFINSSRDYSGDVIVEYSAGDSILLNNGFSISLGSTFQALIETCSSP